jgi:hypothetical protein
VVRQIIYANIVFSYLYGGLRPNGANINGSTGFDDLYILSIPAFVWIKYYPSVAGTAFPHHSLTCNVINGTQMIIVGGTFPNSTSCDVSVVYGQHSADLGQNNPDDASFNVFRQNDPPYLIPSSITQLIGGTSVHPILYWFLSGKLLTA